MMRGVRAHYTRFVDALSEREAKAAQLGLAHSYSRAKAGASVSVSVSVSCLGVILPGNRRTHATNHRCTTHRSLSLSHMAPHISEFTGRDLAPTANHRFPPPSSWPGPFPLATQSSAPASTSAAWQQPGSRMLLTAVAIRSGEPAGLVTGIRSGASEADPQHCAEGSQCSEPSQTQG